ncbi:MAG: putative replicase [Hubei sediment virgavirus 1]|nr:MAG: putative replicase [Hubei sediment virgavirus 1]
MTTINNTISQVRVEPSKLETDLATRRLYDESLSILNKRDKRIKYSYTRVVTPAQANMINAAYPEFNIIYDESVNSVHPVAGGVRGLELEYLMTLIPFGAPTYDIGGAWPSHMLKGRSYVHCCNPVLDVRDATRKQSWKDSIRRVVGKPGFLKPYQMKAFQRYDQNPVHVTCSHKFEDCEFEFGSEATYATSLHSLYDVDPDILGKALKKKGVTFLYAVMHMHPMMFVDNTSYEMSEINARFRTTDEHLIFNFQNESSNAYVHKLSYVRKYLKHVYFAVDDRYVYYKEFLKERVGSKYMKFTLVDTCTISKDVFQHFSAADLGAVGGNWATEGSVVANTQNLVNLLIRGASVLYDKTLLEIWFPEAKKYVLVPIFEGFLERKKIIKRKMQMFDRNFVFTILNHIQTYSEKQLTWQAVLSFAESIRSRVIVNGSTVRGEWDDIDKADLKDLSISLFLICKVNTVIAEIVIKSQKIETCGRNMFAMMWEKICEKIGEEFTSLRTCLVEWGMATARDDILRIRGLDPYLSFEDFITYQYQGEIDDHPVDVKPLLSNSEKLYERLEAYAGKTVDFKKFEEFVASRKWNSTMVVEVLEALKSGELGLSVQENSPETQADGTEAAKILTATELEDDISDVMDQAWSVSMTHVQKLLPDNETMGYNWDDDRPVDDLKYKEVVLFGTVKERQMRNMVNYLNKHLTAVVATLSRLLSDFVSAPGSSTGYRTCGLWDNEKQEWILVPTEASHVWGVALHRNGKKIIKRVSWEKNKEGKEENDAKKSKPILCKEFVKFAVSTDTKLFVEIQKIRVYLKHGFKEPKAKFVLVDGVPGCGKTKEIIERANLDKDASKGDLVLCAGKAATEAMRVRFINVAHKEANKSNVRTIDSYVIKTPHTHHDTLWIDEGLMVHPGEVLYVASLAQAKTVYVYGDTKQIPFINRVADFVIPKDLVSLKVDDVEERNVTLRCPADVTSFLNSVYGRKITTKSNVSKSLRAELLPGSAALVPVRYHLADSKVLTFTQNEKLEMLGRGYKNVQTVHEAQGETFQSVALVRLQYQNMPIIDEGSEHVTVALSRHTNSLAYYTVKADHVYARIENFSKVSDIILRNFKFLGFTK